MLFAVILVVGVISAACGDGAPDQSNPATLKSATYSLQVTHRVGSVP